MGYRHAGVGEVPERGRDLGCDPLCLRFHGLEAPRQGGGRAEMSGLIAPRSSLAVCAAVFIASLCLAPAGFVRAAATGTPIDTPNEPGRTLYLKYCSQCHGEKGDGEGY